MATRPFPLRESWIRASPFRNRASVMASEKKYKNGELIGFTALASLRSMGRIPRSDGSYRVGTKYRSIP